MKAVFALKLNLISLLMVLSAFRLETFEEYLTTGGDEYAGERRVDLYP